MTTSSRSDDDDVNVVNKKKSTGMRESPVCVIKTKKVHFILKHSSINKVWFNTDISGSL